MEFQEHAAREVSALIDRLVSDADANAGALLDRHRQEHEAAMTSVRTQLEATSREMETRLREKERPAAVRTHRLGRVHCPATQPEDGDLPAVDRVRPALADRDLFKSYDGMVPEGAHRTGTCGSTVSGRDGRNWPGVAGARPSAQGSR